MSESRLSSFYRFSSWDHVLVVLWYCGTLKHCGTVVLPHAGTLVHWCWWWYTGTLVLVHVLMLVLPSWHYKPTNPPPLPQQNQTTEKTSENLNI